MDNLRSVIKNLFCYISTEEILRGDVKYNNIKEQTFLQLGSGYITKYSNDELRNLYYYFESEFQWQNCKQKGEAPRIAKDRGDNWNVFDALVTFDNAVLIEENGQPMCQYVHLLRWRDMTIVLDEDLFVTSFLAFRDYLSSKQRKNFFWKPVIGHNNRSLNCLVEKGVAENHFHLKGSAPQFQLSWISIMNQVDQADFDKLFESYDKNRMQKNIQYSVGYGSKLGHMWRQAALIRLFLFSKLENEKLTLKWENEDESGIESRVSELLCDENELKDSAGLIQENIERFKSKYKKSELDYLIYKSELVIKDKYDLNGPLSGERYFLYQMFLLIYNKDKDMEPYFNWFYLYLVIKVNIRRELVQANVNVGFDNFSKYQERKDLFIEDSIYEKVYIRMAVRDTILNQHIKYLEARIVPKKTSLDNLAAIKKYDEWITDGLDERESHKLKERYFYVMHFAKESERITQMNTNLTNCRHWKKRNEVESQSRALVDLRNSGAREAVRIRGIDACSAEIWCRPEVFAQAFRYLKNHTVTRERIDIYEEECPLLRATYHVGEDFLDVIDGLRAIDEAMCFLNLNCGDRLGHALALGINIEEWYESKGNRILINKMGYLDNLAWLYAKMRLYHIGDTDGIKSYIEKRFTEYFMEIYQNNMDSGEQRYIMGNAKEYYGKNNIVHSYNRDNLTFDINEYYDSWKLRGDNPQLYADGYFKLAGEMNDEWDKYAVNKEFPQNYKIRYTPEAAMLYYLYHYNPNVKIIGDQMIEVRVDKAMVKVVNEIQKKMQLNICQIGIGIEANPSSNYLIGTFRRYDKHPIIGWYNYGLTVNPEMLEKCPQLHVSINTDDQGVFSTYIENEYAYLALALEKSKRDDGLNVYNRTMILQWLENIRKMGIDQSFMNNNKMDFISSWSDREEE
ncbi:MAG: hypothetical protein J6J79_00010 [Lachnospiraceae bacterium]|nr:hypothetical protein [Lachnospiraceae bacterium]